MKTTSIKFYYNGLRVNGEKKLIRVFYSLDNNAEGREEVSISARDYENLPGDVFAVSNDTDYCTDYFDSDRATVTPSHPLYKFVRAAALKSEIRSAEKYIPTLEKYAALRGPFADGYKKEIAQRREKLEKYRAELETLPKGQPTASDLEAVEAMNNAAETARIAIVPAVGLCFTRGRTREGAQQAAFNCLSALREKIQAANDDDKIWAYYSLINAEPALNMPDCYDDVRPKEPRYQVVVWADECGSDEMMDFNRLNDAIADARRYADKWSYAAVYDRRRKRALVIFGDVSTPVFSDFVEVSAYSGK